MFYCDDCAEPRGWPQSMFKSHGRCETCGQTRTCNDVPSSALPDVPDEVAERLALVVEGEAKARRRAQELMHDSYNREGDR